ncbi:MAG TPA: hypothetical protein VIA18_02180, partial [Polyangia bacterium]|nr:hypothetical protein [Polyangia bacterium]
MAAKDPEARVQSCDAVANALGELELMLRQGTATHERRTDAAAATAQTVERQTDAAPAAGIPPTNIGARPVDDVAPAAASRTPMIVGAIAAAVVAGVIGVLVFARPKTVEPIPKTAEIVPEQPTKPATNPQPKVDVPATGATTTTTAPKVDGPLRVAVLKFKNVGADASLAMLESGIGETAVNAMAQGSTKGDVTLVERSDIESDVGEIDRANDDHFDKATLAKKGQLEGVQMAVQGGFQRAGNKVRITARFVRVANGEIVDTLTVTRPVRDLFGAQDEVARGLSQKLTALARAEKSK